MKHPLQPLVVDTNGTLRFQKNEIVRFLLDAGPFDLNMLAVQEYSNNDREQFAQLIGYSIGGFSELAYVSDETWAEVDLAHERFSAGTHDDEVTPEDVRWANDLLMLVKRAEEGFLLGNTLAHVLAKERTIMRNMLKKELEDAV